MVAQLDILEGTVSRTNSKGFMLQGREGWLNVSRYADPAPAIPAEGTTVRVSLDRAGFVRAVDALDTAPPAQNAATAPERPEDGLPAKERQIIRMNVLGHATAIVAASAQSATVAAEGGAAAFSVAAVLKVATELEAWVTR